MDTLIPSPDQKSMRRVAQVVIPSIAAAAFIPFERPGVNFLIVGMAVLAGFCMEIPRDRPRSRFHYATCALLCLVPFALIDAEWVLALDLLAFIGFAALASGGFSIWRDLRSLPFRFLRALPQIPRSTISPVQHYVRTMAPNRARVAITSIALTSILLIVFGGLFITADRAFASLLKDVLPDLELESFILRAIVFCAAFVGTALLLIIAIEGEQTVDQDTSQPLLGTAEWRISLSLLVLLFSSFVAFQITLFAGGGDRVLSSAGLTYSEYARQGFFQLIAAASLVLALIAAVSFRRPTMDRKLQWLLGALCGLTVVILISALYRLTLYEAAFGFTRPRLLAHALILWLGALLLVLIGCGLAGNYRHVPGIVLALTALSVFTFNALNPDRMIAKFNIERYERVGKLDQQYLASLSLDAYPEIARLPEWVERSWIQTKRTRGTEEDSWNMTRQHFFRRER